MSARLSRTLARALVAGCVVGLAACGAPDAASDDSAIDNLNPKKGGDDTNTSCTTHTLGDSTSCKDEATWQSYAAKFCASQGLQLSNYGVYDSCAKGSYRGVKFQCCKSAPTSCSGHVLGDKTSCKDEATWKSYAAKQCAAQGQTLGTYSVYDSCGQGVYRAVKFECCGSAPPPPTTCSGHYLGNDGMSCKDEATWQAEAAKVCSAKGLKLGAYGLAETCGKSMFAGIKFECCGSAPPPPTSCSTHLAGDEITCHDEATWKQEAAQDCAGMGLQLGSIEYTYPCGSKGSYRFIKYQCCKPTQPPPPPPPSCVTYVEGSESSCKDASTWKLYATQTCTAQGLVLTNLSPYDSCGGTSFRYVKYQCCKPESPPPPPCK